MSACVTQADLTLFLRQASIEDLPEIDGAKPNPALAVQLVKAG